MPKSKAADKKIEKKPIVPADEAEKIIEVDDEAVALEDDELIPGEVEAEEEDEEVLDDDAIEMADPFKDKWEE